MPPEEVVSPQRLDQFLFFARFCKTRAAAAALIEKGGLRINRQPVEKPHARLRLGDTLTLALPRGVIVLEILALARRRVSAPQAQALYQELAPPAHATSDRPSPDDPQQDEKPARQNSV